jgi:Ca2+-dependent lipid-binding protein
MISRSGFVRKTKGDIRIVVAAGVGIGALAINIPVAVKDFQLEVKIYFFCQGNSVRKLFVFAQRVVFELLSKWQLK